MRLLRRLAWLLRHRAREAELADELAAHEAMKRDALLARGLSQDTVADQGRLEMGNATFMREEARAVWIVPWLDSVGQDLRYAARSLRRQPGFTLVAVLTLASAIGLNTSLFTVFNALVLKRYDVFDADRMVRVFNPYCCRREGGPPGGFSADEVRYFAGQSRTMAGFIMTRSTSEGEIAGEARTTWVSGNFFQLLGVRMALGRGFAPDEDLTATPVAVAVLNHAYWRTQLAGDSNVIGRTIRLEGVPYTVIGVAARGFNGIGARPADAWIPLASVQLLRPEDGWMRNVLLQPAHCCTDVAGRLANDATLEAAEAELSALRRRFRAGAEADQQRVVLADFTPIASGKPGAAHRELPGFLLMFAGVGAVLLLACANVGNLLLARAAVRQREIAVRVGLGASRRRIVRQLMTEGLLLAGVAGAIGVAISAWVPSRILHLMMPSGSTLSLAPDGKTLLFTLVVSLTSCLLFALAPALHATRPHGIAGVRTPLRTAFLSVQVALCTVLLVAAGLLARGIRQIARRDLGFASRQTSIVSLSAPAKTVDPPRAGMFVRALASALEPLERASVAGLGMNEVLWNTHHAAIRLPGDRDDSPVERDEISPGYFATLGIPVVAGRNLEMSDAGNGAIVNETLLREAQIDADPIGRTLTVDGRTRTIVGVVKDANLLDVDEVYPTVYEPLSGRQLPVIVIRSDAPGVAEQVTVAVAHLDPRVTVSVTPMIERVVSRTSGTRFAAAVAGGLGGLALLLAGVGMFGVFSYWVQQRTQEIGVRMALGARPAQVIRLVFGVGARAVAAGLAVGVVGAAAGSRVLRSMLYGVSPLDPVAFAGAMIVLLVAGSMALYGPARRATRVDPMTALRSE